MGLDYLTQSLQCANTLLRQIIGCKVKNVGSVDGTQVVQMYVEFKNFCIDRPVKILRGFLRVDLKSYEEKEVMISCPIEKLKWLQHIKTIEK